MANALVDFVSDPRYAKLDDAQRLDAFGELEPEFRALKPKAQRDFISRFESKYRRVPGTEQTGLPPVPKLQAQPAYVSPGIDLREGKRKTTMAEDIAGSYKGTIGEAVAPRAAKWTADIMGRFAGATGESIGGIATKLGNILHALGTVADSDALRVAGGGVATVGKTVEREFKPEKPGGEGVMAQLPEIAGSAIGSMMGFRGAGKLVGKAVEAVAGTGKAGTIANWLATSAVETGTTAGGVYEDELQTGKDPGQAAGAAAKFAAISGPMTAGLNKLGQFNDRIRNPVVKALAEVGGEIAQEDSEQITQNMVTGKPWNLGLAESTVGAVFGSLIGGAAFEHGAVTGIVNDYHEAVKEHGASPETARQVMDRRLTEEAPHTAAMLTTAADEKFDPFTEISGVLRESAKQRDAAVDEFLAEHPEYREEVLGKEDATEPPAVDLAGALPYTPGEESVSGQQSAVSLQPSAISDQRTTADAPVESPAVAPPAQDQRLDADQDADSRTSGTSETPVPADGRTLDSPSQPDNRTDTAKPVTPKQEFSSTQVNLPEKLAGEVRTQAAAIADEDLAEDGRETEPHVTVKYGLHGDDAEQVRKVLADEPPVRVRLGKTSLFENEGGDVVKVDVDSPDLHRLNAKIAGAVENTESYPEYKPHVTLGYVKPGRGKKYAGNAALEGREVVLDRVVFSDRQGNRTEIPLGGSGQPSAISDQPNSSQQSAISDQPVAEVGSEKLKADSRKLKAKAAEVQPTLPKLKQRPFAEAVQAHGRWEAKLLAAHEAGKSTAFIGKMVDKHAAVLRKQLGDDAGPLTADEILGEARAKRQIFDGRASTEQEGGKEPDSPRRGLPGGGQGGATRRMEPSISLGREQASGGTKRSAISGDRSSGRRDDEVSTSAPQTATAGRSQRRQATSAGVASADLLASPVLRGAELLAAGVRTFREWKSRLIAEYGPSIKHKAYSLWAAAKRLWNDETGTLRLDKLAKWYRDSVVKSGIEWLKPHRTRIANAGERAGHELMRLLDRFRNEGEVLAGMLIVKLRDAKLANLDREERFQLLDALEGRIQPDKLTEKVREVFQAARYVNDELAAIAMGLDVQVFTSDGKRDFMKRRDYFPHVIRSTEALKGGPVRKDVLENLVRIKAAADETEAETMLNNFINGVEHGRWDNRILEYLIRTGQANGRADALAKLQRMRSNVHRHGSLEYSRDVHLPFYDPDPVRVLPWVASTQALRLAQIAELGQKNERLNAEILKIRDAGGNENYVREQVDRILGQIMDADADEKKLSLYFRTAMSLKLVWAQIPNAVQAVVGTALAGDFPALLAGFRGIMTAKGRRFAIESGAAIDSVLSEAARDLGEKRFIDAYLKWTGFSAAEQNNRIFAANAGADLARRLFQSVQKGGRRSKWAKDKLSDLGIDVAEALERGSLSHGELLMAAKLFSDMVNFRTRPDDFPAMAQYKLWWQFKSFSYSFSRLIAKETVGEWRRGNPGRAIRTLLVIGVFAPFVGDLVRALRDLIRGKDREFEDGYARYVEALLSVGGLGIVTDALRAASSGRVLEFAAGPALSDMASLTTSVARADGAKAKALAVQKYVTRRVVPVGERYTKAVDELIEEWLGN